MERKFYKSVNGEWVEAPQNLETETGTIFNYNAESNEAELRKNGYIPEDEINVEIIQEVELTLEERMSDIEQVTTEVITTLNDKGIIV